MSHFQRDENVCGLCNNSGWQELIIPLEKDVAGENVYARPCACSILPIANRSASPACNPDWIEDRMGRWRRNPDHPIQPVIRMSHYSTGKSKVVFLDRRTGKEAGNVF
jgi:hypothetical protein